MGLTILWFVLAINFLAVGLVIAAVLIFKRRRLICRVTDACNRKALSGKIIFVPRSFHGERMAEASAPDVAAGEPPLPPSAGMGDHETKRRKPSFKGGRS